MRILLVEDDELISEALVKALTDQHYAIDVATDGQAGCELVEAFAYDLILLDVMLPKLDGISLCRRWRSQGLRSPIILLTSQDNSTKKVMGLDAGADDYVVKPFDLQEMLARIRALLRRGNLTSSPLLEWGNLRLDPSNFEVTYDQQPLHLTPKEYSLLELFLRNRQRIFSCSAILDRIWSFEELPGEETVRSHMKGLRQKLKAAGVPEDPIETVYGIGYRLKSLQEQARKGQVVQNRVSPAQKQQTLVEIARVWERTKEKLSHRIATIEQATTALRQNQLSDELQFAAEREAHKLAGSLGMYGFVQGSRLAQEIEHFFQSGKPIDRNQTLHLSELIVALHQELQQTTTGQTPQVSSGDKQPWLLLVERDKSLAKALVVEAATWKIRAEVATTPTLARERIFSDRPDIVVLDLCANTPQDNLTLLFELNACTPPVPVLVLVDRDRSIDRVKVARLGGRGFLPKPVTPSQVLEAVTQILLRDRTTAAKVMVVDDDTQVLTALHSLLEPWGFKLSTLDCPLQFWDNLETVAPDLLILDVEMPQISGIDLCQSVRADMRWSSLPILFLTAHTDADTMQQVFATGGDDYVSKPIVGPELVTRILNRLDRSRLLRNLVETDALTGIANYRKSSQELTQLLDLCDRHQQPLCFAVLNLDHFKQVNEWYGHASGDTVLTCLGELLRRHFQSDDVVGRWGGAEFIVGMYGITRSDGVKRLAEVLKALHQQKFTAFDGTQFQVTLSAAAIQYSQDGINLAALYKAAALRQAQAVGSDRGNSPKA
ncbi:DNA-binding response regulator, OmpR family, containings REC and winged-helix [Nostoc flagelliforme CCNUN1]|uniref:DNA-binding response regulator, OmpR family, containings REC and winged-helix n=1 Tax=Nostoc flagelliforme CCNUN1 TaxID=2038116 RepID=A0A2K8T453_9NOSO|nr:response regulator [Nostoc flagelliforme]AUB42498.1 DNA-binding response regulator, OmpR family, containings REC and winged-helix [Nostoc flagelliforme CCNUN1]